MDNLSWKAIMPTTAACSIENTITSASEGFNPLPRSTDFWTNSSFNCLRTSKHALESTGKLSENVIHFVTCTIKVAS